MIRSQFFVALILACNVLALPAMVFAQKNDDATAAASASVRVSSVQIAEPFDLTVAVTAPRGTRVTFPPAADKLGPLDVVGHRDALDIPAADEDQRTWTKIYTLESIDTGELVIPPIQIIVSRDGSQKALATKPVTINVRSVLENRADPMDFRDIHSVVDLPVPQPASYPRLWWALGSVAGLTLAISGIAAMSRRQKWQTPEAWAFAKLNALSPNEDSVPDQISTILRDFLEMQFGITAPMQTTKELLRLLAADRLVSADVASGFEDLFTLGDQAKFAGLRLQQAEVAGAIDDARRLVERTSLDFSGHVASEAAQTSHEIVTRPGTGDSCDNRSNDQQHGPEVP